MSNPLSAYNRFLSALERSGVPYRIHAHAASVTFQDAAEFLDFPLERLLKTVAFQVKNGPWVLAALRGRDRVDYKKLAAHLEINRTQLRSLPPDEVETKLDYPLGGVAPFPTRPNTRIIFDKRAVDLGVIFCGTGRNDHTLEISAPALAALCGASIAPIGCEP